MISSVFLNIVTLESVPCHRLTLMSCLIRFGETRLFPSVWCGRWLYILQTGSWDCCCKTSLFNFVIAGTSHKCWSSVFYMAASVGKLLNGVQAAYEAVSRGRWNLSADDQTAGHFSFGVSHDKPSENVFVHLLFMMLFGYVVFSLHDAHSSLFRLA